MKLILLLVLVVAAVSLHAFNGDPALGNSKLCIHHVDGAGSHSYGLVVHPQTCPPYQGTTTSDSGIVVHETHPVASGPTYSPTNVSTSQHCWTEEKDMGN